MPGFILSLARSNRIYRIAVGTLFFLQGLCFATWASRIPGIQQTLELSDGQLGMVLFALPVGSMLGLPFAGFLVNRFGSKRTAANALLLYSLMLVGIGFAQNAWLLVICLVLFGVAGNISNIAINTQAVAVEAKYKRNIMGSFHGLWSLAGFTAAGIGSFMIGKNIMPLSHFIGVAALLIGMLSLCFQYLVPSEENSTVSKTLLVKPDKALLKLGLIAFCCMVCEGAMFDWSGIYFQKVVGAEGSMIAAGYTAFMLTMATGRFISDFIAHRLGFQNTIQLSGLLIATGLFISIILPFAIPAMIGFMIVGLGVSSVVPLVYSEAGKSAHISPGMALASVSSIGFLGFLAGPPLIGVIAGLFSLKISFLVIAFFGLTIVALLKRK